MSAQTDLADKLRVIAEQCVLQEEPYPVAAPESVDQAVAMIQAARDHSFHVMVLGSGSSFPADFSLHRTNVLALLSVRLTGIEQLSPFTARVYSGTTARTLFDSAIDLPRKTLGGLLCSIYRAGEDHFLRTLWPHVQRLQIITGSGDVQYMPGPAGFSVDSCGSAHIMLGSRGRVGMVTAAEFQCPLPISDGDRDHDNLRTASVVCETPLCRADIQPLFDTSGLFQW